MKICGYTGFTPEAAAAAAAAALEKSFVGADLRN